MPVWFLQLNLDMHDFYIESLGVDVQRFAVVPDTSGSSRRGSRWCPCYLNLLSIPDVVVSASVEPEAFDLVAVEAQAMKKPVIASAHGGSLGTVRDGVKGWLYQADNPAALAEKILLACDTTTDLETMGNRGRQWVEEKFTIDNMCRAEWQAYAKVLAS